METTKRTGRFNIPGQAEAYDRFKRHMAETADARERAAIERRIAAWTNNDRKEN